MSNYPEIILFYTNSNPSSFCFCSPKKEAEFVIAHINRGIELKLFSRPCRFLGDRNSLFPDNPSIIKADLQPTNQTISVDSLPPKQQFLFM